jgi:hypothetical protein
MTILRKNRKTLKDNNFGKRRKTGSLKMNAETIKQKNRFPAPALSGSGSKGLSQAVS